MDDVLVIGGGVIGLSIAFELAGQGATVAVLEQADFGREASWAGAGILPPGNPSAAETAEAQLRALSHSLWSQWAGELSEETGIDIGYARCGGLEVRLDTAADFSSAKSPDLLGEEIRSWRQEGVQVEELTPDALRTLEPGISSRVRAAYRLPELGQVRNPRLMKALIAGCTVRGVRLFGGTPVSVIEASKEGVSGVRTPGGRVSAGRYCVAGGPWSRMLLSSVAVDIPIRPIRGQIVLLSHVPRLFSHVIQVGARYLVPRADGKLLIGSTEEDVGFVKKNTPPAIGELLAFGLSVAPALAKAGLERTWSGLRPGSPQGIPFLGRVAQYENLFVAAGHFRSGLQMSPGTAHLLRQSLLEQETTISLKPFAISRQRSEQKIQSH